MIEDIIIPLAFTSVIHCLHNWIASVIMQEQDRRDHPSPFNFSTLSDLSDYLHGQSIRSHQLIGEPLAAQPAVAIAPLQVLTSRDRYQCCHIRCSASESESDNFVPAIFFEGQYYSLLRTEHVAHDAFRIATHIMQPDRLITLTKIPKGYAIWISEPEAIPSPSLATKKKKSKKISPGPSAMSVSSQPITSPKGLPYKILTSEDQYQLFHLQLPHTIKNNVAVRVDDYYYRLFQRVETIRQAAKTTKLLAHCGERSVITKIPNGYGIWRLDTSLHQHEFCTPYAKD